MKLLAIFAHPDDEAFGPGGTLARYAWNGHPVRLVTLTRGEAGTLGISRNLTMTALAELRSKELQCSTRALHISSLKIYDLPDGQLSKISAMQGMNIIGQEIEAFQPDVLVTFHYKGISGHPDHIAVSSWCLQTVRRLASPPRFLYYGISEDQARRITFRRLLPMEEAEITHVIDASEYVQYKIAAIQCHRSQSALWEQIKKQKGDFYSLARTENFSQAWPRLKTSRIVKNLLED